MVRGAGVLSQETNISLAHRIVGPKNVLGRFSK